MNVSHSGNGAERVAFDQAGDNLPLFLGAQFVHALICLTAQASQLKNIKSYKKSIDKTVDR